jgi:hypothetical protein
MGKKHSVMQLWLMALLGVLACERPAPRTPVAGYRAFAEALRRSDAHGAWATLSRPTRAALEARARDIATASGGLIKEDPALMVFQSGTRPAPVGEVKVLQADDRAAVVEVVGARGPQRVALVRDGDEWLVDLADIFSEKQPAP